MKLFNVLLFLTVVGKELKIWAPLELKLLPVCSSSPLPCPDWVGGGHSLLQVDWFPIVDDLEGLNSCLVEDKLPYTEPPAVLEKPPSRCPP